MKRALSLLLVSALSLSLLAGCSAAEQLSAEPISLTAQELSAHGPDTQNACDVLSTFGLELLRNTKQACESTLLSPLSVILALSMAANGAEGETMAQFQETMGGVSLEALNAACQFLLSDYRQLGGSTRASIANSLWVDPEGQISEEFTGRCMGIYGAEVFQGELSSSGIVNDVNRWVSKQTKGLIPELVQQPFPEDTAALLVNALYLNNTWELEFDPISTYPRKFTHSGGQVEQMDFLHHSFTDLLYLQGEGAQGVVLPYDDGRLASAAILPDSPDLGGWLDSLNGNALSQLVQGADEQRFLYLAFPKFEAEWSGSLQEILKDMGLEDAFTPGQADFSRMGDHPNGYYLSEVLHAAKLQVNEKGTEAAAATLVAAGSGAPPPAEGIELLLDRPFLYGIFDRQNGIPLFLGTFE
ncbi:MAG: serpin family protein [Oscillospiraceae bacterium]|jgi:serine protease inhibitor|nr:serpin family protein [Oscillospiraceae bacterium]